MNTATRKDKTLNSFIHILYLVFFTSLVFSFRAVSSMSIGAILLAGILTNSSLVSTLFHKNNRNLFIAGCILLFLLQVIALLYTINMQAGWNNTRIKAGLVITPLAICFTKYLNNGTRKKLLSHYCLLLMAATLYCLCLSFLNYQETNNISVFFYHALVRPINQHAVYFSLLLLTGLIFLFESISQKEFLFNRLFHICLIVYFSAFLFLLSSKLIIVFYLFYMLSWFIRVLQKNKKNRVLITLFLALSIITVSLVFTMRNPVSKRFYEIIKGDIGIVTQDKFKQSDYFNGLQFRLLQWKFVAEILTEKNRWWIGVSPGDAQLLLNEKYISKNMYSGDPARGSRGYLIYNTHNQFLQTILQNGIIGLAVLLFICFTLLKIAVRAKNRMTSFIILLLLAWLFIESAFETQYGILIFTFFPLFMNAGNNNQIKDRKANLLTNKSD